MVFSFLFLDRLLPLTASAPEVEGAFLVDLLIEYPPFDICSTTPLDSQGALAAFFVLITVFVLPHHREDGNPERLPLLRVGSCEVEFWEVCVLECARRADNRVPSGAVELICYQSMPRTAYHADQLPRS